jgi:hypothetical protein
MNSSSSPALSAFTYRYVKRQPATPAEQARHPETISDRAAITDPRGASDERARVR